MNINELLHAIQDWAIDQNNVVAVLLVGSYARKQNKEKSDIDIKVIVNDKDELLNDRGFINRFGVVDREELEQHEEATSIRVFYQDGKEVEFSVVDSQWMNLPLPKGTFKVLSNGYKIILDKKGFFQGLMI